METLAARGVGLLVVGVKGVGTLTQPQQTHHGQVGVVRGEAQAQLGLHLRGHPLQHAVEHVVVPLIRGLQERRRAESQKKETKMYRKDLKLEGGPAASHLSTHAGLLQQVLLYLGPFDRPSLVEVDVDVLPEAAGVVVANGLGVAEG